MREIQEFKNFEIDRGVRFDRNKLYYGFIHNFSSPHTRDAYTRDLRAFLNFLQDHFRSLTEVHVEHAHVVAFKDYLIQNEYSPKTINRFLATLWSFYEYLIDMDLVDRNPAERVKRFKVQKEVKTQDLKDDEVTELIGAIDDSTPSGMLHKAILTMFFTTGMRHREVSHLKFKHLDEENGYTVVRYFAKGSKEMVTPLNPKALEALSLYLQWAKAKDYSMEKEDYIFRSTKSFDNRPLDPKSMNYIIKKYAKMIGIRGNITIHSARSTVIGMLLDKGHAIERVADFVGHRDISMTKAYNKRKLKIHQSLSLDL